MPRAVVYFNPSSGSGSSASRASELAEHMRRSSAFEVIEMAMDVSGKCFAAAKNFDLAVVVGGDGSLNAALQEAKNVPIAFLAGGTANVAGRVLHLPSEPAAFARALASAQTVEVPVAYADERRWLLFAEVGYQAEAVARVNTEQAGRPGKQSFRRLRKHLAFARAFFTELGRKGPELEVQVGRNGEIPGEILRGTNVLMFRTPWYGAWFKLPLDVDPSQPEFGVLVIRASSRFARISILLLALLRLLPLLRGPLERAGLLSVRRADFVRVQANAPTACHVDAESLPFLPGVFRLAHGESVRLVKARERRIGRINAVGGSRSSGATRLRVLLGSVALVLTAGALVFHPTRPLYMRHRSIEVVSSDGTVLSATLSLPRWVRPKVPAMVLVHGSGPLTREHLRGDLRRLVREGFGVLAYDKRGAGSSGGVYVGFSASTADSLLRVLAADAAAALERVRREPEVDPSRVGFFGASQAGWIIPLAAQLLNPPPRFHVILSGPAVSTSVEELYSTLTGDGHQAAQLTDASEIERRVLSFEGDPGYDPAPVLRASEVPTLWLLGDRDLSVPTFATIQVLDSLQAAKSPHSVIRYRDADHQLRDVNTGAAAPLWADMLSWLHEIGAIDPDPR